MQPWFMEDLWLGKAHLLVEAIFKVLTSFSTVPPLGLCMLKAQHCGTATIVHHNVSPAVHQCEVTLKSNHCNMALLVHHFNLIVHHAVMLMPCCTVVLHHATILIHHHAIALLCCHATVLVHCYATVLICCHATVPICHHATILICHHPITHITILIHHHTIALVPCHPATILILHHNLTLHGHFPYPNLCIKGTCHAIQCWPLPPP